ncbi:MAG: antibiotic biosynthesis monooxygenase [Rubellimicrobium sp.]|nr:antibiotic biosynthesis monooxygenase [Rubellimicrobium sp.]
MFIAMNRFRIVPGREAEFEQVWRGRESRLGDVPGFRAFSLLQGPRAEDHSLYVSHSVWADEASFRDWTRSEAFRAAHRDAADTRGLYLEAPRFEGFAAVLSETAKA